MSSTLDCLFYFSFPVCVILGRFQREAPQSAVWTRVEGSIEKLFEAHEILCKLLSSRWREASCKVLLCLLENALLISQKNLGFDYSVEDSSSSFFIIQKRSGVEQHVAMVQLVWRTPCRCPWKGSSPWQWGWGRSSWQPRLVCWLGKKPSDPS